MRKTKQKVNPEKTNRRRTQSKKPCHRKKCVWNTWKRHVYMIQRQWLVFIVCLKKSGTLVKRENESLEWKAVLFSSV